MALNLPRPLGLAVSAVLAFSLSGCGSVVGSLVPPQTISNPAGLTGATLTSGVPLQAESVQGSVSYSTESTTPKSSFADIEYPSSVPFGIRPHALRFDTRIASAHLTGLCALPASFTLTLKTVRISVKDAYGAASVGLAPAGTVTLTRIANAVTGAADYQADGNTVQLNAETTTTEAALKVLTSGGTNDATLEAVISASDNGLSGCTLSLKLGETNAVLSSFS